MRFAVVGHVEWVDYARVERVPRPGEIAHASDAWSEAAGGGGVAAAQLAKLAGDATLFTAFGDDDFGRRSARELEGRGVHIEAVFRPKPQRRGFTFVDSTGERTITVIGERLGPMGDEPLAWDELEQAEGVYFVSGDVASVRAARAARTLVATARSLPELAAAGVQLDALVHSGNDEGERYAEGDIDPPPRLVVTTAGEQGGSWATDSGERGSYSAAPLPGEPSDAYGAGDSFAAGLTFGLASGLELEATLELAARCGASVITGSGGYAGQLRLAGSEG